IPAFSLSSPPERTTFRPHHHHHHRSHEGRTPLFSGNNRHLIAQPPVTANQLLDTRPDTFGIRPVREVDRLPSMLPALQNGITSQPESPTTPNAPVQPRPGSPRATVSHSRPRRRPSIRHQLSMSGDSDEGPTDDILADDPEAAVSGQNEPIVGLQQADITMQDIVDSEEMQDGAMNTVRLTPPASENAESETFNITHRSVIDGSIINPATPQVIPPAPIGLAVSPVQPTFNVTNATPAPLQLNWYPQHTRFTQDRPLTTTANAFAAMPRDEDVLMSLQLLAYVSKYCNLRAYFQHSHLVPKLKIPLDTGADGSIADTAMANDEINPEDDPDCEYLLPASLNIFPLVEKFTVRHHSQDMQYWAGVVMRNLCRKDDARGGIRQCAYYACGKWEEWTRQFAKCRRCRRTKYCSKECQKSAWVWHRHWCVAAAADQSGSRS
ncbi:hypothetical protein LTS18_007935, partial [Coniosporium uncinatum]